MLVDENNAAQEQIMITETFKSKTNFYEKYPSKLYICSFCGTLSQDRYQCSKCGFRADGLFKTMDKGYQYTIEETGETEEIFKPLELKNDW